MPSVSVPRSDAELVAAMTHDDDSAISELYDRHSAAIMGVAVKILRSREDAEDLVHDVFVEAWRRAGSYRQDKASVRTWLLVRARSRSLDRLRARETVRRHAAAEASAPPEPHLTGADDPSLTPDHRLARESLRDLPEPQREALELAYFAGLSCSEIAKRIGKPTGTVKSRMAAGLAHLRVALGPGVIQ